MKVNNYFLTLVFHKSPSSVIVSTFYFVIAYMLKEILPWITCSWKEVLEGSKLSLYWNLDLNQDENLCISQF